MCEYAENIAASQNYDYPIGTTIVNKTFNKVVYIKIDRKNWAMVDMSSRTIYSVDVFTPGKIRQSIWDGTDNSFEIRIPQ